MSSSFDQLSNQQQESALATLRIVIATLELLPPQSVQLSTLPPATSTSTPKLPPLNAVELIADIELMLSA